jgi:hypothetical protein
MTDAKWWQYLTWLFGSDELKNDEKRAIIPRRVIRFTLKGILSTTIVIFSYSKLLSFSVLTYILFIVSEKCTCSRRVHIEGHMNRFEFLLSWTIIPIMIDLGLFCQRIEGILSTTIVILSYSKLLSFSVLTFIKWRLTLSYAAKDTILFFKKHDNLDIKGYMLPFHVWIKFLKCSNDVSCLKW